MFAIGAGTGGIVLILLISKQIRQDLQAGLDVLLEAAVGFTVKVFAGLLIVMVLIRG